MVLINMLNAEDIQVSATDESTLIWPLVDIILNPPDTQKTRITAACLRIRIG